MKQQRRDQQTDSLYAPSGNAHKRGLALYLTLAIVFLVAVSGCGGGQSDPSPLTRAILNEDWAQVIQLVDQSASGEPMRAPEKYIKGHALLALNENNSATCLFWTVSDDDLARWETWTQAFQQRNPDEAVSFYLKGDAAARQGRWEEATEHFSDGLTRAPADALLLNARGAAYAGAGRWDEAIADFQKATAANPSLADAYASLGTAYVLGRTGAEGAVDAFDRAIEISPSFSLAYNGRASAKFALQKWDETQRDFEQAASAAPCAAEVIAANLAQSLELLNGPQEAGSGDCQQEQQAGTTVQRFVAAVIASPTQGNMNALVSYLREVPADRPVAFTMLQSAAVVSPQLGTQLGSFSQNGVRTNTGLIPAALNLLSGLQASVGFQYKPGEASAITAKMGYDFSNFAARQQSVTTGNLQVWSGIQTAVANPVYTAGSLTGIVNPSGVTTDLCDANVDEGQWPSSTAYGLVYPVSTEESDS